MHFLTSLANARHMSFVAISLSAYRLNDLINFSEDYKSKEILLVASINTSFFS